MQTEISVVATYLGGMKVEATADGHAVLMDYPVPPSREAAEGFTPLQLLLASLAGCAGNVIPLLLRRMKQPLSGLQIRTRGLRRSEHPTVITEIDVEFIVKGSGLDPATVANAIREADEHLCPVWAMLRPGTTIRTSHKIEPA
jgi:putative redox protein